VLVQRLQLNIQQLACIKTAVSAPIVTPPSQILDPD
jgi:hypothetical protein